MISENKISEKLAKKLEKNMEQDAKISAPEEYSLSVCGVFDEFHNIEIDLCKAIKEGIVDAQLGIYRNSFSNVCLPIHEAIGQGFIRVKICENLIRASGSGQNILYKVYLFNSKVIAVKC